jgi:hypothetical protein
VSFTQAAGLRISPAVTTQAGWCLGFAQSVLGAPVKYRSATLAANAVTDMHADLNIPSGVALPVWFDHYGTYGSPPEYGNWGHVVVHMPNDRYLSSPLNGVGQAWWDSIGQIERAYNATYRGWSTNINGLTVATLGTPAKPIREQHMKILSVEGNAFLVGPSFCSMFPDDVAYQVARQMWGDAIQLGSGDDWNRATWTLGIPVNVRPELVAKFKGGWGCWDYQRGFYVGSNGNAGEASTVAATVVSSLGSINVNTDAIASAIATKLGAPESEPITKADIQAAIEANYKESK